MNAKKHRRHWRQLLAVAVCVAGSGAASATEQTVQNDSLTAGGSGSLQAGFVAGESAATWLTSPCDGNIVAVQVFWRSLLGTAPQSLEDSITIFAAGSFPTPGAVLETLQGPVMTDSVINEFRFLNQEQTIPLIVPVTQGQTFVVSFKFANQPNPLLGPSVVTDVDGCQFGKNGIFAIPGGWLDVCLLGVSGDFVIRAVIDCNPTAACCFTGGSCADLTTDDCTTATGFPQASGTNCATFICFPEGACCNSDGTCDDGIPDTDCVAGGGTFQGDGVLCAAVTCPQPVGACCLAGGGCLSPQTEANCTGIPGASWMGADTVCGDGSICIPPPPANDACADKIMIAAGSTVFDTTGATTDGAVEASCAFPIGDNDIHNDIWYNYIGCDGAVTVDVCGSTYDTRIAVYEGCTCLPAGPPLTCNDDDCGLQSSVTFNTSAGVCYKIRVGGFSLGDAGSGVLTITESCGGACVGFGDCAGVDLIACTVEKCIAEVCVIFPFISGDIDKDGTAGLGDLLLMLNMLGGAPEDPNADLDADGVIGLGDLLPLLNILGGAGSPCPA